MRVRFAQTFAPLGLAVALVGLAAAVTTGCNGDNVAPNTAGSGGASASGGATGSGGSKAGGTTGTSSNPGSGGSSSTTTASGAGGGSGTSDASAPPNPGAGGTTGSGGATSTTIDAAPTPDANWKMPKLNTTDYKPPFDPSTVPGIQPLFDGETMTGWNCNPAGWAVANAYIKGNPASSGQFCATGGLYSEFRIFASINQVAGQHAGIGVAGANPTGTWGQAAFKFHTLMTPSIYFWDYFINKGDDGGTTKTVDMTAAPYNIPWQGKWFQVEMLVSITKGTIRAAMNGVDFMTHSFTPRNGVAPCPIGLQSHGGNVDVRYKDLWIEVNPKQPDTLLSATK